MWWFSPAQEQALVVESLFAQWCGMTICDWPVHQKKTQVWSFCFCTEQWGKRFLSGFLSAWKYLLPSCRACVAFSHELSCFSLPLAPPFLNHLNHCNGTSDIANKHTDLALSQRGPAELWLSSFLQTPAQLSRTACHLSKAACSWRSENTFTNAPFSSNKLKGEKGSNDVLVRIFSWCVFSQGPLFC